ncbi:hypothetical protein [Actinomadura gamaensis]|uniref:Serine/threonine protein kinase n=1 Tax=Actinomadura gamaensis TaxID=1763541 RepID=A0ABV9TVW0_9ACTN
MTPERDSAMNTGRDSAMNTGRDGAMNTVIICLDRGRGRPPRVHELADGESVVFGWASPRADGPDAGGRDDAALALALGEDEVGVPAGRIRAVDGYWLMTNQSRWRTYCVENLEGGGEYVKVPARRVGMPVPFELSRVRLGLPHRHGRFTVFAPERGELGVPDATGDRTSPLDEASRYFMVLVCLCEPRLRDCCSAAVPTPGQVSARLAAFGDDRALTRSAVNYHIDYLAEKLEVAGPPGGPRTSKRETLAALALKFDLVREEHLALLPAATAETGGPVAQGAPGKAGGAVAQDAPRKAAGAVAQGASGKAGGTVVQGASGKAGGAVVQDASEKAGGRVVQDASGKAGGAVVRGVSGRRIGAFVGDLGADRRELAQGRNG